MSGMGRCVRAAWALGALWLTGCGQPLVAGGVDAFATDAAPAADAARTSDAGADVGIDAFALVLDVGVDVGSDAFVSPDVGMDAFAVDAGTDAFVPVDVGTDAFAAVDAGTDAYVPLDAGTDAFVATTTPRPIAPLSTSTVTSRRPTLRWVLPAGADGARVELCRDRACTLPLGTTDVAGTAMAPGTDLPAGVVYWRLRARRGATTDLAFGPTWQFYVGARSAPVDTSSGTTFDVDGDGFADLAVGASTTPANVGSAYVYLGSAAGVAATPTTTLVGPDRGNAGAAVASAGDVNGDGYADLAVGSPAFSGGTGRVYVYLGGPGGVAASPATTLVGPGTLSNFGWSLASAGDVNGDGYADLVVGAWGTSSSAGSAYVYLGGPAGLGTVATTTYVGLGGRLHEFGFSVASAGDIDGDGYSDLVIGEPFPRGGPGRAYVYLGGASGPGATPATMLAGFYPTRGSFGGGVAGLGDVNGDGYSDVVVSSPEAGTTLAGEVYVYLGGVGGIAATPSHTFVPSAGASGFGSSVAGAGDVDGDGYADLAITEDISSATGPALVFVYLGGVSGVASTAAVVLSEPDGPSSLFGRPVVGAGDVNHDGFAELAMGAYRAASSTGHAYLYAGSMSGLGSAPMANLVGPAGTGGSFGTSVY